MKLYRAYFTKDYKSVGHHDFEAETDMEAHEEAERVGHEKGLDVSKIYKVGEQV